MDLKVLDEYAEKKLLRRADNGVLVQYNYTDYCNNNDGWDDITLNNRGNVYEKKTGNLIAKSFPKFFNFEQLSEDKQQWVLEHNDFMVTKKYDGCLGLIYKYQDEIYCNGRGSFVSHVTDTMYKLIKNYNFDNDILDKYTLVCEVISPETHIIVDYGDLEELRLITAYDKNNWQEISYDDMVQLANILKMPYVEQVNMTLDELFEQQKQGKAEQEEGFVLRYSDFDNFRVKIKDVDYMRIAKFKAHLNKRMIWKLLKEQYEQGKSGCLDEYMNNVPDELMSLAKIYLSEIEQAMNEEKGKVMALYNNIKDKSCKELGLYFNDNPSIYKGAIFSLKNDKPIERFLIKLVEPPVEDITSRLDIIE